MQNHKIKLALFVSLLGVASFAATLRAESIIDTAAVQKMVTDIEQKIDSVQNRDIASDLASKMGRLKESTSKMVELAATADSFNEKLALIKVDFDGKYAAYQQYNAGIKNGLADVNARLEQLRSAIETHNASVSTDKDEAASAAYNAEAADQNARHAQLDAEREQTRTRLIEEGKPISEAYEKVYYEQEKAQQDKQQAVNAVYAEYKTWQDLQVWLSAAADVAASGGNPAEALMPFPGGGPAPAAADLAPAAAPAPEGTNVDAGAQLKSVAMHSGIAAETGSKEEAAKGFDVPGQDNGSLVVVGASAGRPTPAFVSNLPDAAKNDAQLQQSIAYYEKLDSVKADTLQKIQALQEEQKSGKGDPAILAAHLGTLTNDLKRSESDQAQAKEAAKKRVVDLGFNWDETPPPAAGAKK